MGQGPIEGETSTDSVDVPVEGGSKVGNGGGSWRWEAERAEGERGRADGPCYTGDAAGAVEKPARKQFVFPIGRPRP